MVAELSVMGLWYEDENIGCKYYRYRFDNGAELIVEESRGTPYFHLVGGPEAAYGSLGPKWSHHTEYCRYPNSETELVEFLKEVQKSDKEKNT